MNYKSVFLSLENSSPMKTFISMSSIPPRIKDPQFMKHLLHFHRQTQSFEKLFLCLSTSYRRFPDETIPNSIIQDIEKIPFVEIIWMEDFGPSNKFLGPLIYKEQQLKNNILIIVDDDRFYDVDMVKLYHQFFNLYSANVASGNQELYFNKLFYTGIINDNYLDIRTSSSKYVAAFMSFSLCFRQDWKKLIAYTKEIIQNINGAFYHDEGILLNYFRFSNQTVYYLNYKFINHVNEEMEAALCTSNTICRKDIESEILDYTNSKNILNIQYTIFPNSRLRKMLG